MSSKSSSKKRLPAFLASVIKAPAGLLAATWSSSQRGLDPIDGGKLEDWPTLRLRIPTSVEGTGAAQTARPQQQGDRLFSSVPPPPAALPGGVWERATEIRKPEEVPSLYETASLHHRSALWTAAAAASATDLDCQIWYPIPLHHRGRHGLASEDVPDPQEKPALPIRQPGLTLRRRTPTLPLVTVRVLNPNPDEGLATLFIGGPSFSTAPPVTVYRDGTVDTRRPTLYLPYRTYEQPSELNLQFDHMVQQSRAVRALEARQAALAGHNNLVDTFATDVLGLARSARWREAVSTALLGDWIEPLFAGQRLDDAAVARLRADARTTHRHLMPLWRRRTRHGRVLLLDTPLSDGLTLHDLASGITGTEATPLEYDPEDVRLAALIKALRPAERVAALAWADPNVRSWAEAAQQAGVDDPAAFGERVRRKCRRLAAEFARRRSLTVHTEGRSA
ncbi:hypothetical protein [Streptomyces sp. A30]|uniref:hypothetical protein n=1 Tax=Streptomyces sp. A30 TaxID=2789273 RepID=UPI00397F2CC8